MTFGNQRTRCALAALLVSLASTPDALGQELSLNGFGDLNYGYRFGDPVDDAAATSLETFGEDQALTSTHSGFGLVGTDLVLTAELPEDIVYLGVAHGIETEDQRRAAGRPLEGKIRLAVAVSDQRLKVSVKDDGAGIDWRNFGLGADADDRARIQALVSSGSSAAEVTDLAGRGVGLAAVFKTVEQLQGDLAVSSHVGEGTEFEASVPVHGWVGVRHSFPPVSHS